MQTETAEYNRGWSGYSPIPYYRFVAKQVPMSRVKQQHEHAKKFLASGVSSSTRVNQALGHAMLFERAEGCRVWDLDGRELIDLCTSHGATLLGHGDERVRATVEAAIARGAACSYESQRHAELADLLCRSIPCLE